MSEHEIKIIKEFSFRQISSIMLNRDWGRSLNKACHLYNMIIRAIDKDEDVGKPITRFIKWHNTLKLKHLPHE